MNTDSVKKLLKEYDNRTEVNQNRIMELYKQMNRSNSVIDDIGQISRSFIDVSKNKERGDISDLMSKHEEMEKQRTLDIRRELAKLIEEQELLNRVWMCFQTLQGSEYQVIHELYIKKVPYKRVLSDFGRSEKTFLKTINQGLFKIINLYNSDYANGEIRKGFQK